MAPAQAAQQAFSSSLLRRLLRRHGREGEQEGQGRCIWHGQLQRPLERAIVLELPALAAGEDGELRRDGDGEEGDGRGATSEDHGQ